MSRAVRVAATGSANGPSPPLWASRPRQRSSSGILAGVNQDGDKYCQQLTVRYREELTKARSDQATKECKRLVASGKGNRLPLAVTTRVTSADPQSAEAAIRSSIPELVELRTEGGSFKVDGVDEPGSAVDGRRSEGDRRKQRRSRNDARD